MSVRSVLSGVIGSIKDDGPIAMIDISLDGGGCLAAIATRQAADELHLVCGARVFALIKATAIDERAIAQAPSV